VDSRLGLSGLQRCGESGEGRERGKAEITKALALIHRSTFTGSLSIGEI
jgi:hypothetical protein